GDADVRDWAESDDDRVERGDQYEPNEEREKGLAELERDRTPRDAASGPALRRKQRLGLAPSAPIGAHDAGDVADASDEHQEFAEHIGVPADRDRHRNEEERENRH